MEGNIYKNKKSNSLSNKYFKLIKSMIDSIDISENNGDLAEFYSKKLKEIYEVNLNPEEVLGKEGITNEYRNNCPIL